VEPGRAEPVVSPSPAAQSACRGLLASFRIADQRYDSPTVADHTVRGAGVPGPKVAIGGSVDEARDFDPPVTDPAGARLAREELGREFARAGWDIDAGRDWVRAGILGAAAGLVTGLLYVASQLVGAPDVLEATNTDAVRRLLFFVLPIGFVAGLTFDAVYTKLRGADVGQATTLERV
jgi:hypothetical protein